MLVCWLFRGPRRLCLTCHVKHFGPIDYLLSIRDVHWQCRSIAHSLALGSGTVVVISCSKQRGDRRDRRGCSCGSGADHRSCRFSDQEEKFFTKVSTCSGRCIYGPYSLRSGGRELLVFIWASSACIHPTETECCSVFPCVMGSV